MLKERWCWFFFYIVQRCLNGTGHNIALSHSLILSLPKRHSDDSRCGLNWIYFTLMNLLPQPTGTLHLVFVCGGWLCTCFYKRGGVQCITPVKITAKFSNNDILSPQMSTIWTCCRRTWYTIQLIPGKNLNWKKSRYSCSVSYCYEEKKIEKHLLYSIKI